MKLSEMLAVMAGEDDVPVEIDDEGLERLREVLRRTTEREIKEERTPSGDYLLDPGSGRLERTEGADAVVAQTGETHERLVEGIELVVRNPNRRFAVLLEAGGDVPTTILPGAEARLFVPQMLERRGVRFRAVGVAERTVPDEEPGDQVEKEAVEELNHAKANPARGFWDVMRQIVREELQAHLVKTQL